MAKSRAFVFTLNNYDQKDLDRLCNPDGLQYRYIIFGQEIAPTTGTRHLQGFVYFKNPRYQSGVRKLFKWWITVSKDNKNYYKEAIEYCKKDEKFYEWGEPPNQGDRTDLDSIAEEIINNGARIRDIAINGNYQQLRWAETCSRYVEPPFRRDQEIIWIYGKAGSGKTRLVYDLEDHDNIWKWNGNKWFDGYDGHKVVLLDDYRQDVLDTVFVLNLLDIYPMRVEVKGGFRPLVCVKIYITCVHEPDEVFIGAREPIEQLLRRITRIIKVDEKGVGTEVKKG